MSMHGERVFLRLVGWCLAGALTGFAVFEVSGLLDGQKQQIVRSQATARAMDHVRLGILPQLQAEDFTAPHSEAKLADIDSRLRPLLRRMTPDESGLVGVDLIAADGIIVYSDEPAQAGQQASDRERVAVERTLTPGIESVTRQKSTVSPEKDPDGTVDVYVPVSIDGMLVGAYEIDVLLPMASSSWGAAWILVGCAGGGVAFAADRARLTRRRRTRSVHAAPGVAASRPSLILTPRERQVLELLAVGGSYRSVALELVVSEETVRSHVKRILRKTGQANRTAAVTAALRAGVIQLPGDAGRAYRKSPERVKPLPA